MVHVHIIILRESERIHVNFFTFYAIIIDKKICKRYDLTEVKKILTNVKEKKDGKKFV